MPAPDQSGSVPDEHPREAEGRRCQLSTGLQYRVPLARTETRGLQQRLTQDAGDRHAQGIRCAGISVPAPARGRMGGATSTGFRHTGHVIEIDKGQLHGLGPGGLEGRPVGREQRVPDREEGAVQP